MSDCCEFKRIFLCKGNFFKRLTDISWKFTAAILVLALCSANRALIVPTEPRNQ